MKIRIKLLLTIIVMFVMLPIMAQQLTPRTWYTNNYGEKQGVKEEWNTDDLGRKNGMYHFYKEDGTIIKAIEYSHGVMNGKYYSVNDDVLGPNASLLGGLAVLANYDQIAKHGAEYIKGTMVNGKRNGVFTWLDSNNNSVASINYKNGLKNGEALNFDYVISYNQFGKNFSGKIKEISGVKSYFQNDIFLYRVDEQGVKSYFIDEIKKASADYLEENSKNNNQKEINNFMINAISWINNNIPASTRKDELVKYINDYKNELNQKRESSIIYEKSCNVIKNINSSLEDKLINLEKISKMGNAGKCYEEFTQLKSDIESNKSVTHKVANSFYQPLFTDIVKENSFLTFFYNDKSNLEDKISKNIRSRGVFSEYEYDGNGNYSITFAHSKDCRLFWIETADSVHLKFQNGDSSLSEKTFLKKDNSYIDVDKLIVNYCNVIQDKNSLLSDKMNNLKNLSKMGTAANVYEEFTQLKSDVESNKAVNHKVTNTFYQPLFTDIVKENPFLAFFYKDESKLDDSNDRIIYKFSCALRDRDEKDIFIKEYEFDGNGNCSITFTNNYRLLWKETAKNVRLEFYPGNTSSSYTRTYAKKNNGYQLKQKSFGSQLLKAAMDGASAPAGRPHR